MQRLASSITLAAVIINAFQYLFIATLYENQSVLNIKKNIGFLPVFDSDDNVSTGL